MVDIRQPHAYDLLSLLGWQAEKGNRLEPRSVFNNLLDKAIPYSEKTPVTGRIVCVLQARADKRGLVLCPYPSRAVLKNEIHEVILTAEEAGPGKTVNQIAYLGYFEVPRGWGAVGRGYRPGLDGVEIGRLAGYDLTHFPNHMNVIVQVQGALRTGFESGCQPGSQIVFTQPLAAVQR